MNEFEQMFSVWGSPDCERLLPYSKKKDKPLGMKHYNKKTDQYFYSRNVAVDQQKEVIGQILRDEYEKLPDINDGENHTLAVLVRQNWQVEEVRQIGKRLNLYVETESGGDLYYIDPTLEFYKLVLALQYPDNPKYLFNLYSTCYWNINLNRMDLFQVKGNRNELISISY